jgi:hypothetical protein
MKKWGGRTARIDCEGSLATSENTTKKFKTFGRFQTVQKKKKKKKKKKMGCKFGFWTV